MAMALSMMRVLPAKAAGVKTDRRSSVVCNARRVEFGQAVAAVTAATALAVGSAHALTYDQLQSMSYLQTLKAGSYKLEGFCMEPMAFQVRDESQFKGGKPAFVDTRLLTRLTYSLDAMSGTLKVGADGTAEMAEEDGMDYAATTVQLPGGERVPFLFTIKQFAGKGPLGAIAGDFDVPSYRGSTFMDPKGRGGSTGYESAIGLQTKQDDDAILKENDKKFAVLKGSAVFSVAKVDSETGEVAGVFESMQPGDTDMGAKTPKDVRVRGLWYARLQ
ncbi:hypothetical protein HYH03_001756 [Edaphochlamys debaryana]|uniref:Uncharacterized protein n=1 Tax=Edaphochlamys debaryana TaxID=47281 RepID=A0A835YEB3_9CHLO|nr:hypothetical protein HYH03_001756 [Edaphochlamys debaryana]|eukprot:KAG2500174.1 hypothetical protein HYH03_001756 [Edaphochlamys debaryana]